MHLGMTGRFAVDQRTARSELGAFAQRSADAEARAYRVPSRRRHRGALLRCAPLRLMDLIPTERLDQHALFKGLGIEPLSPDFTAEWLAQRLKGKATSIKAALIDQRLIAGLGNIYACEALFRARHLAAEARGLARHQIRQADQADRSAGRGDQGRARGRDQGRRLVVARLSPRRRQARALPASLQGVWPRGQALLKKRLRRNRTPHRPGRTLDLLLSNLSTLGDLEPSCLRMSSPPGNPNLKHRKERRLRDDPRLDQGQGRAHHAQPPACAQRAQRAS